MTTTRARPSRLPISGLALGIAVAALYTLGMALMFGFADNVYADAPLLLREVLPYLALLVALTVLVAWLSGLRPQRTLRVRPVALIGIVPVAVLLVGAASTLTGSDVDWGLVGAVAIGTLLVGIGEETAFRGIVLNALGERLSVIGAVVISSIFFGLLHAANLTVQGAGSTAVQIIITTLIGLTLAWIYVGTGGNLVLVIALHALYDFGLLAPAATGAGANPLVGIVIIVLLTLSVVFTIIGIRRYRGHRLADILASRRDDVSRAR